MGAGTAISSMNSSIKSNKALLKGRKSLKEIYFEYGFKSKSHTAKNSSRSIKAYEEITKLNIQRHKKKYLDQC